ncbi:TetR family transcriptional regulator [Stackebrandtia endophytica]|uniref:TetR family transcriptional regulator n=2 Tax=Stackebrandtia endophytica TaxID=1496996 RepID=A0A543AQ67_9ACTN|nr:TetR family transcriptional regulator [Stackebrandtia endophytica]
MNVMTGRRRGAVRSEAARRAILSATARLFAQAGYDNLAMERIAAEAGVGKQTIYRWWPSKGELVAECLLEGMLLPQRFALTDTGDLRADLVDWIQRLFDILSEPGGEGLLRSLIAAATENADVGRRLRDSLGGTSSIAVRLASAVASSQLRADAPLQEVGEALIGAVLVRALGRVPVAEGDAARLVDAVLGNSLGGG